MKERQRWQPEEDALLLAYINQHGPKDFLFISQRMGKPFHRDPKSCLERWKNYLKPGVKKGSLTPQEQSLVISLQAKYGNKWKKIAAQLPGRTAKRLGKWWEVFKEKQLKQLQKSHHSNHQYYCGQLYSDSQGRVSGLSAAGLESPEKAVQGRYDHILETFAEKYVQPKLHAFPSLNLNTVLPNMAIPDPDPVLSLGSVSSTTSSSSLPPWMNTASSTSSTPSPSISLSLSPPEPVLDPEMMTRFMPVQQMGTLIQYCKEVEEGRQSWMQHKKEATWRLSRLEQQLESEKARKRREKMEEIEAKIRCLREEESGFLSRIESEYREQLRALQRDAESKEAKMVEAWCTKHANMAKLVGQIGMQSYGLFASKDLR